MICLAGVAFALVGTAGCNNDEPNLGLEPVCVTFLPDSEPIPGNVVARYGAGSICDTADVELVVTGVDNVYGASFTVEYDAAVFFLVTPISTEGSFLSEDGTVNLIVVSSGPPGAKVIGVTRTGVPDGVDATIDNDLLATLQFIRGTTVDSNVTFPEVTASLRSPGDPDPVKIPDVVWFGGRLDVN